MYVWKYSNNPSSRLQSNWDMVSDLLLNKLTRTVKRTSYASSLCLLFSSQPLSVLQIKSKWPNFTTYRCIYKLCCPCRESFTLFKTRKISLWVWKHLPSWLANGVKKSVISSTLSQLVDSGHFIEKTKSFRVMYFMFWDSISYSAYSGSYRDSSQNL